MTRRSIVVISAVLFVLSLATAVLAADPFVGTWKLNVVKSTFPPGQAPKSAILTITIQGNVLKIADDLVVADGSSTHEERSLNLDGIEQPITGNPGIDSIIFKRVDANTLVSIGKREGKEAGSTSYGVTKDGKALTVNMKRKNPQGQDSLNTLVYEKQ
jgi:hypothetical protein